MCINIIAIMFRGTDVLLYLLLVLQLTRLMLVVVLDSAYIHTVYCVYIKYNIIFLFS